MTVPNRPRPARPAGAVALAALALGLLGLASPASAGEFTVVSGAPVPLAGGEQVCFALVPDSGPDARLLVRVRFTSEVPGGHVEVDGAPGPELWAAAEEFVFTVRRSGTHRLTLKTTAPATIDRLVLESPDGGVREADCARYEEDQRRRVESSAPPAPPPVNRLGAPAPAPPPTPPEAAPWPEPAAETAATLPAGTELELRMQGTVSTATAYAGQRFTTEVVDAVRGPDGSVVLPAGTRIDGTVLKSRDAGRFGRAELTLGFDRAVLGDGREVALTGSLQRLGKGSAKKQGGIIAGSAIGGAILGDILDVSPAVGAVVGGAIAAGSIAAKPGEPVVVPAGSLLGVRLEADAVVPAAPAAR